MLSRSILPLTADDTSKQELPEVALDGWRVRLALQKWRGEPGSARLSYRII